MNLYDVQQFNLGFKSYGRPAYDLTDERWQQEFTLSKGLVEPSKEKRMAGMYSTVSNDPNKETSHQRYTSFINDVLSNIRAGGFDYCYFGYQIWDLLKYEYNNLKTRYLKDYECWEVWLDV